MRMLNFSLCASFVLYIVLNVLSDVGGNLDDRIAFGIRCLPLVGCIVLAVKVESFASAEVMALLTTVFLGGMAAYEMDAQSLNLVRFDIPLYGVIGFLVLGVSSLFLELRQKGAPKL